MVWRWVLSRVEREVKWSSRDMEGDVKSRVKIGEDG
jgi:hypothetical protein